jgi:hypothetical protein
MSLYLSAWLIATCRTRRDVSDSEADFQHFSIFVSSRKNRDIAFDGLV